MVRAKKRYLLCEIFHGDGKRMIRKLHGKEVYICIRDAIIQAYGDYGYAVLMNYLGVKYLNPKTNMVLIKSPRGGHLLVQSAITFVKKIGMHDAFFRTLHIGGTIRSCQKFLVQYHRQSLPLIFQECKTEEERKEVQNSILSACAEMESMHGQDHSSILTMEEIIGENG